MQTLTAACGSTFTVDDDVWEWARHENWYLKNGYPCHYVKSTRHGQKDNYEACLHRQLVDFPIGHVHHKDENPLNCRRDNLEILTPAAHYHTHSRALKISTAMRAAGPRSASGYKGVSWHKRLQRWTAQLYIHGKNRVIGYTHSPEEAALLYDAAVLAFIPGSYTNLVPDLSL